MWRWLHKEVKIRSARWAYIKLLVDWSSASISYGQMRPFIYLKGRHTTLMRDAINQLVSHLNRFSLLSNWGCPITPPSLIASDKASVTPSNLVEQQVEWTTEMKDNCLFYTFDPSKLEFFFKFNLLRPVNKLLSPPHQYQITQAFTSFFSSITIKDQLKFKTIAQYVCSCCSAQCSSPTSHHPFMGI